jgi:hypothetical protein
MKELLRLYGEITLLRRGPQDLPASPLVLAFTVLANFAVNSAMALALPAFEGPWLVLLVVEILFELAWYALLLRAVSKPERFLQTASAMFGYQTLLAPLALTAASFLKRYSGDQQSSELLLATIVTLAVVIWVISVGAHILKAALEWKLLASEALVIAQFLAARTLLDAHFSSSS